MTQPSSWRALSPEPVQRLVIRPLPLGALHTLIRSRLGLNLARPMLVRVAEASGGNPLFALEIADTIARTQDGLALGDVPASAADTAGAATRPR